MLQAAPRKEPMCGIAPVTGRSWKTVERISDMMIVRPSRKKFDASSHLQTLCFEAKRALYLIQQYGR